MELGQYQLQIFVSLVVILAACVALICDFLKRNNEQLRELTIELKVRWEEEQKRSHLLAPRVTERAPKTEKTVASPAAPSAPKQHVAVGKDRKRTVNPEALAAMERGAALAGSGGRPRSAAFAPVAESKPEPKPEVMVVAQEQKPVKKDWGTLLNRNAATNHSTNHAIAPQVSDILLPAGFQDGFVLNKLVQSHQPVSGLVVSIGVSAASKSDGKLPAAVHELVQSLIGPHDFAAQSSDDEFLLIYPQERGASAQRRLSQIAQQLWDFQLRSLGSFQILFSWGGLEVSSESIDEAIASASERMQETRRGRKLLTMSAPLAAGETQLRQAV